LYIILAVGLILLKRDSREAVRGMFFKRSPAQAFKKH
jgi:hypothetical protein